jgi:nicotinamidase-related amidase
MGKFLVVVDMQNDFIDGALGTEDAVRIVARVAEKIRGFGGRTLFTQDTHGPDYQDTQEGRNLPVPHCVRGTAGWRLHDELEELRRDSGGEIFTKPTFGSKALGEYLERENRKAPVESVELVGLCTDICVISNALLLKAFLPESEIIVDASCCAGSTPENHRRALDAMRACQVRVL